MKARLTITAMQALIVCLLVTGCGAGQSFGATSTPIGVNLTPVAVIDTSTSQELGIVDIFLTGAQEKLFDAEETMPPVFNSGIKKVSVVIIFDPAPPDGTSFDWEIKRAEEVVQMSGYSSLLSGPYENGLKVIIPLETAEGQFSDGIYQATLYINKSPFAELNWIVGAP